MGKKKTNKSSGKKWVTIRTTTEEIAKYKAWKKSKG